MSNNELNKKELEHLEKLIPLLEQRRYRLRKELEEVSTSSTLNQTNEDLKFLTQVREKYFK